MDPGDVHLDGLGGHLDGDLVRKASRGHLDAEISAAVELHHRLNLDRPKPTEFSADQVRSRRQGAEVESAVFSGGLLVNSADEHLGAEGDTNPREPDPFAVDDDTVEFAGRIGGLTGPGNQSDDETTYR